MIEGPWFFKSVDFGFCIGKYITRTPRHLALLFREQHVEGSGREDGMRLTSAAKTLYGR